MTTEPTPERRLTMTEMFLAIGVQPSGWKALHQDLRLIAEAQLAKDDAWWQKREAKLVMTLKTARGVLYSIRHLTNSFGHIIS